MKQEDCLAWLKRHIIDFKQAYLYTLSADFHVLTSKKGASNNSQKATYNVFWRLFT